jgi:hypothetical protein
VEGSPVVAANDPVQQVGEPGQHQTVDEMDPEPAAAVVTATKKPRARQGKRRQQPLEEGEETVVPAKKTRTRRGRGQQVKEGPSNAAATADPVQQEGEEENPQPDVTPTLPVPMPANTPVDAARPIHNYHSPVYYVYNHGTVRNSYGQQE